MFRIFLVEDDPAISGVLERQLTAWNYQVGLVQDFQDVLGDFRTFQPHLVLLDISLPYRNGYHWCEEIRKISKVPILFLSSASDNLNLIMAVNLGGDDFLAKPFDLHVLLAKVQALLRRAYDFGAPEPTLEHRGAVLDPAAATLSYEGQRLSLTKNECRILQTLLEQKGKIVGRDALMQRLWETDSYVDENALTVNVARLRRKLEGAGLEDFITTKKGMGYRIGE
ncbi:MAG: response regulator transcription factor [Firmicutes bacterium]|jgi:response regulators consisting of a cheY-like receiver domain and a winged-helix DNA-binding domain|nr:response regulator transcription factor [Bacillota bacterium]